MASVLDAVKYYQQSIEKYPNDEEKVLKCIDKLFHLDVTTQHLQETGVGRTVNALRKEPGEVGTAARSLVYKWKRMVAAEESDHEGDPRNDSSMHNGNGSGKESDDNSRQHRSRHEQYERPTTKPSHTQHRQMNGHSTENKRKYHSSEEEEPNTKKKRHSVSDDDHKRPVLVKQEKLSDSESDDESDSSESDSSYTSESSREDTKNRNNRQEVKIKEEPQSPDRNKSSKSHHSHHQDHRRESSSKRSQEPEKHSSHSSKSKDSPRLTSESSKSSSHKHKSSHDRENSSDKKHKSDNKSPEEKRESKESTRQNSLERQKSSSHKQDHSQHKSSSDSHSSKSDRHRSSDKVSDKHRSSDKESDKHGNSDSVSDKNRSSNKESDKHRSLSQTDKENDKHKSSDKESGRHKSSSERESSKHRSKESGSSSSKDKHSSSNTEKSKDRSSSSSKDKSSSHKEKKHSSSDSKSQEKPKHERSEDRSEKKSKDKSSSSSHKSKSKSKDEIPKKKSKKSNSEEYEEGIDCGSGASFAEALGMMVSPTKPKKKSYKDVSPSNSFCNDLSPASLLAPTAKLAPLPILEISALPEISPNYKPRPPPKPLPHFSDEDAISAGISSKNQRTKVYSGNKVLGKVTSLYAMCVTVLQEHIDALEYTGGVPYDILKPVIDKATPSQLFVLEHYNPYLMEDTDHLWQKNCEKNFRNKKRQEMETWRDMYLRCQEEQECKLKSLTANIRLTQEAKKAPIKQTKMAYVDNFVKPPRNVARKQAIHGTAHSATASPAARVASLASGPNVLKGGPRPPNAAPVSSTSFNKPKKAPLMQKALQFMRGRKR